MKVFDTTMNSNRFRLLKFGVLGSVAALVFPAISLFQGCAHVPPEPMWVSTAADQTLLPAQLEFTAAPPALMIAQTPMTKLRATGQGALGGAVGGMQIASYGTGPWAFVGLVFVPVGAIGGGIYGVAAGYTEAQVQKAKLAMDAAQSGFDVNQVLTTTLMAATNGSTNGARAKLLTPAAREHQTAPATNSSSAEPLGVAVAMSTANTDPKPQEGARLRVSVLKYLLAGNAGINPALTLIIDVECDLIRPTDGATAGVLYARYLSHPARYMAWADENAKKLSSELHIATTNLAQKIDQWLSGSTPPAIPVRPLL